MAEAPRTVTVDAPEFQIFGQLLIAFGQGAGAIYVSPDVITASASEYLPRIRTHLDGWDRDALRAIEFARAVGRLSAHLAMHDGTPTIGPDHFERALRETLSKPSVMQPCPFC